MYLCPIQVWNLYTSKLNKSFKYLWQKPKQGRIHYTDETWFEMKIVSKDALNRFMKFLSKELKLSISYTNHSICATVISTLNCNGFEARHILKLSSHKKSLLLKNIVLSVPKINAKKCSLHCPMHWFKAKRPNLALLPNLLTMKALFQM